MLFDRAASKDKSAYFIANMYHDMLLEPGAPTVFRIVDDWLLERTKDQDTNTSRSVAVFEDSFVAKGTDVVEDDILHVIRHRVSLQDAVEHRVKGAKVKLKAMSALLHTAMHAMGGGGGSTAGRTKEALKED